MEGRLVLRSFFLCLLLCPSFLSPAPFSFSAFCCGRKIGDEDDRRLTAEEMQLEVWRTKYARLLGQWWRPRAEEEREEEGRKRNQIHLSPFFSVAGALSAPLGPSLEVVRVEELVKTLYLHEVTIRDLTVGRIPPKGQLSSACPRRKRYACLFKKTSAIREEEARMDVSNPCKISLASPRPEARSIRGQPHRVEAGMLRNFEKFEQTTAFTTASLPGSSDDDESPTRGRSPFIELFLSVDEIAAIQAQAWRFAVKDLMVFELTPPASQFRQVIGMVKLLAAVEKRMIKYGVRRLEREWKKFRGKKAMRGGWKSRNTGSPLQIGPHVEFRSRAANALFCVASFLDGKLQRVLDPGPVLGALSDAIGDHLGVLGKSKRGRIALKEVALSIGGEPETFGSRGVDDDIREGALTPDVSPATDYHFLWFLFGSSPSSSSQQNPPEMRASSLVSTIFASVMRKVDRAGLSSSPQALLQAARPERAVGSGCSSAGLNGVSSPPLECFEDREALDEEGSERSTSMVSSMADFGQWTGSTPRNFKETVLL